MVEVNDLAEICRIVRSPRMWARIGEDGIDATSYQPQGIYYSNGQGLINFRSFSAVAVEIHIFMESVNGVEDFIQEACQAMFDRGVKKIVMQVPAHNWHAINLAKKIGFKVDGRLKAVFLWRGKLRDIVFGSYDGIR